MKKFFIALIACIILSGCSVLPVSNTGSQSSDTFISSDLSSHNTSATIEAKIESSFPNISKEGISNNVEQNPYLSHLFNGSKEYQVEFENGQPILAQLDTVKLNAECTKQDGDLIYYSKLISGDPHSDVPVKGETRCYNVKTKEDIKIADVFFMDIKKYGDMLYGSTEQDGIIKTLNVKTSKVNAYNFKSILNKMNVKTEDDMFNGFIDYYVYQDYLVCYYQDVTSYLLKLNLEDNKCELMASGNYIVLTNYKNAIYTDTGNGQIEALDMDTFKKAIICNTSKNYSERNIFVYDDELYLIYEDNQDTGWYMLKSDLSGTNIKIIKISDAKGDFNFEFIQNGYLFLVSYNNKKDSSGSEEAYCQLKSIDLPTGVSKEYTFN